MLTWRYWSSNIRRISCSFGCWARNAKWADSTASPESFVMRNPRGRNSFASSRGGPNHEYSSTGGVRAVAAVRPRSSAVATCWSLGWSSMACDRTGATHMTTSAQARKVLILASWRYVPRRVAAVKLAGLEELVYTERAMGWRRVEQGIETQTLEIQPATCPVCRKGLYRNITFLTGGGARGSQCNEVVHSAWLRGGSVLALAVTRLLR